MIFKMKGMRNFLRFIAFVVVCNPGIVVAQEMLAFSETGDTKSSKPVVENLPAFEFKVSATTYDFNSVPKEMIGEHMFGEEISGKLYLLDSKYTYEVPIVPGNPQVRTMIRKPAIYEAVFKIERYLKKSVKKGDISLEKATSSFNKVLDVAFNILTADTDRFERTISETNDIKSLAYLFIQGVNLVN